MVVGYILISAYGDASRLPDAAYASTTWMQETGAVSLRYAHMGMLDR